MMASAHINEGIITHKSALLDPGIELQRTPSPLIFCLPTEILEIIFVRYARDHHSKFCGIFTLNAPIWVNVSYVCRHWRNVALNSPTLWSYISVTSPRWMEELLARSKQAPLKLHVNLCRLDEGSRDLRLFEQLMVHVERIQELCLQLPEIRDDTTLDYIFSKVSSHAPCLRDLQISMGGYPLKWTPVLFDEDTSALHFLELSNCSMPWYSLNLSGLTTLSLRSIPYPFQQNMEEFLFTLNRMQGLTHLYLEDALVSAAGFLSSATMNTFQKINLPKLSRLLIVAPVSTVIALLSYVDIPSKTLVRLACCCESGHGPDEFVPLTLLLPRMFGTSSTTIRSMCIECPEWGKSTLTFSASECDSNPFISTPCEEWDPHIPLQVIIYFSAFSSLGGGGNQIVSDICCSLPLTGVQSVHILHPPPSPSFLKHALGHVQDLRYLKLTRGMVSDLSWIFSMLGLTPNYGRMEDQDGPGDRGPDWVFAPALVGLELHKILLLAPSAADEDVRSLYGALSTLQRFRGQQTTARHTITQYGPHAELDMVWRWESGPVATGMQP